MPEMPQRQLALKLRYAIDVAARSNRADHRAAAVNLAKANPKGWASKHVINNLGDGRVALLRRWLGDAV